MSEHVMKMNLEDIVGDRFGRYSKYIIQDRALPDVRDGLKPVQRRILFSMDQEGNNSTKAYRKSAKGVGAVMGNYHPHGDSSIYEAMARLSQDWKVRYPLIDMHGNNGSIDGDSVASMRYTEVRLNALAEELLNDINKETVDYVDNFDDTAKEPVVLPASFPGLLVNGSSGISSGYATNIPPHNMSEVLDASIEVLRGKAKSVDDLMEFVKGPDFPGGGIMQGEEGLKKAYETGKGRVVLRAKVSKSRAQGKQRLTITEIPYEINKALLVQRMDMIRLDKKVEGILEVRDETDREGMKIVIELKRDADREAVLNYLYKNTDLQVYYNFNMVAIDGYKPKTMGLYEMLNHFVEHRKTVVKRRTEYELKRAKHRHHILDGLMKAVSKIDLVIKDIKASKDKKESKEKIQARLKIDEIQAEAIVTLQLYRLSNTDIQELQKEKDQLEKEIARLNGILESEVKLKNVVKKELEHIKQVYGDARRTEVQEEIEKVEVDLSSVIAEENVVVSVTKAGYVKKTSLRSYNSTNGDGDMGLKDGDEVVMVKHGKSTDKLLIFTNKGSYIYLPVFEVDDTRWKDVGMHLSTKVNVPSGEEIVEAFNIAEFDKKTYVTIAKKNAKMKRTKLMDHEVQRYKRALCAIKVEDESDEVMKVWLTTGGKEFVMISKEGFGLRFKEDDLAPKGMRTSGMNGMYLTRENDEVRDVVLVDSKETLEEFETKYGKVKRGKRGSVAKKV